MILQYLHAFKLLSVGYKLNHSVISEITRFAVKWCYKVI